MSDFAGVFLYDLHLVERFCDKHTCNYKMPPPNVPVVAFLVKQADSRYTNSTKNQTWTPQIHSEFPQIEGIRNRKLSPFFKQICIKLFGSKKGCSSFFCCGENRKTTPYPTTCRSWSFANSWRTIDKKKLRHSTGVFRLGGFLLNR